MIVLAIDTSGSGCSAAIYDSGSDAILGQSGANIGRGHAERLMEFVDEALASADRPIGDIDRIAVTIGPGSFTGIRVGVATARGLALALGKPAVGISSLHVLAQEARAAAPGKAVLVAIDAKRDEVYVQAFDAAGRAVTEAEALAVMTARDRFAGFEGCVAGSGADLLTSVTPVKTADLVDIAVVARLGAGADPASAKPKPLYLRGPDAKPQAGFAVTRA
ncbi:tRNA (adenosine(37)-N6)-threonylcarbamoyltransferase complex dimerization subunit type 1 TsaB [Sinorhizobium sp. A49]|jgi:tRNA threonylcarbamoyladenosine biosynthesis protein TsaB|uniref:tRNA (adenosine(37)-N6)-threonylcarbamoyltransferase complex dimerization subunit type 1 TsaB n=1 Tax=Sinorhizobium sp. A49 TaxID=1945861 RepID=UPI0009852F61|nr:tRNA (adenosine(37)-N6)-threonylcarbamoyltransferase complex dimerization subunit type 1 TsaB [Sinorhizobium sp. A49]OOG68347.1 tRNA (adenosine(37)-N6)-threonylcarbamoyltransferase complex dimerization subunit type 1 TsaB [Sinorhizobium sp. A49]